MGISEEDALRIRTLWKIPFLNPDQLTHWCGPENIAQVRIVDESCWALFDNGSMVNAVTPEFDKAHSLDIVPLSDLVDSTLNVNGFGRLSTQPFGYIIIRVQVERMWAYDEDQVALVVPDQ